VGASDFTKVMCMRSTISNRLAGGLLRDSDARVGALARAARPAPIRIAPDVLLIWFLAVLGFYSLSHSSAALPFAFVRRSRPSSRFTSSMLSMRPLQRQTGRIFLLLYGGALVIAGAAALVGLAMLRLWPSALTSALNAFSITEIDLPSAAHRSFRALAMSIGSRRHDGAWRLPAQKREGGA